HDLIESMHADWQASGKAASRMVLRVDGGMSASDWALQRLADILAAPEDRPTILETTAHGAAWLAGRQAGIWPDQADFARRWQLDRRFQPQMPEGQRRQRLALWRDAVRRTLSD